MNELIQFLLSLDPTVMLKSYIIFSCVLVVYLTMLFLKPFFSWEDEHGKVNIHNTYIWLEFDDDEYINHTRTKVNGRLAALANRVELQGVQVNSRCIHNDKFVRACWAVYGTGRKQPDLIN